MTSNDPDKPAPPFQGVEYPSLENAPPDPYAPVDYPDAAVPTPIYPPPPTGYPTAYFPSYDPYQSMRPLGTNGKALASLVVSVVSIVACCGIPSIVGLILGIVAMRETRRTGQDGWGLALAGTILGGLAVAGLLIYVLIYVALIASGWSLV